MSKFTKKFRVKKFEKASIKLKCVFEKKKKSQVKKKRLKMNSQQNCTARPPKKDKDSKTKSL